MKSPTRGLRDEQEVEIHLVVETKSTDNIDELDADERMKVQTIDTKRRLVLPGAQPGECDAVRKAGPGHYELAKVLPAPRLKPTPDELDALLVSAALTPRMSWEELRHLTREP